MIVMAIVADSPKPCTKGYFCQNQNDTYNDKATQCVEHTVGMKNKRSTLTWFCFLCLISVFVFFGSDFGCLRVFLVDFRYFWGILGGVSGFFKNVFGYILVVLGCYWVFWDVCACFGVFLGFLGVFECLFRYF